MGFYQVRWKRSAAKELKTLPRATLLRVLEAVDTLATDPRPRNARKLTGSERTYRIRVGDYRVLYTVEDDMLTVEVVRVGHRRDAYR
jgi:mRNA interferase RelE/StbE